MPPTAMLLFGGSAIALADAVCLASGSSIPSTPGACLAKALFLALVGGVMALVTRKPPGARV